MKEEVVKIKEEFSKEKIKDIKDFEQIKIKYLGKNGFVTRLSSYIKDASLEEKKEYGLILNEIKNYITNAISEKIEVLKDNSKDNNRIDITLPSKKLRRGSKHPVTIVTEEIEDLFVSMGYDVVSGPELESDLYNFEMLNLPKGHPARDTQDSFYINEELLLRTQTSPMQVRTMLANKEKTPLRIICPGKTYRRDNDDGTHSHQFCQVEGLVIDKDVSLADLKGTLEIFAKKLVGENSKLRFRPSFFPFTEPSYEVDVTCFKCGGKGCGFCKNNGWIEVFAAGMVHPNVLKMSGYDPNKYTGFAFGPGLDRITMFKYGIPDIRHLYTNDYRFLKNFERGNE
ncbi:MAG TPA: phenylalanine--tRNA ligase subunit alpha [Bacilli bacterium]|nr:phenylalanine--tRNA ligase subunit alpha [Bacilli bacterium]